MLPEAPPGLVEVGGADAVGRGQVVVEPAEEIRLVRFVEVMAVGAGNVVERGPAVLRWNRRVDLLQEAAGQERREVAGVVVEQPGQWRVVVAEIWADVVALMHLQHDGHVWMTDGGQHELVGRDIDQEQAIEVDAVVGDPEMRPLVAVGAHGGVQPTQSLHLHHAGHRVTRLAVAAPCRASASRTAAWRVVAD